jgi:hypothetical protein
MLRVAEGSVTVSPSSSSVMMIWQPSREVEHVLLVLGRLLQAVVILGIDDDVAGRAGERALAGAFQADPVLMRDLQDGQADGRVQLVALSVGVDERDLRHDL